MSKPITNRQRVTLADATRGLTELPMTSLFRSTIRIATTRVHALHDARRMTAYAETLAEYTAVLLDRTGTPWHARSRGQLREDGLWEGWFEFESEAADGHASALEGERETTQPNRTDLLYWAQGITPVYLEGAFARAAARH